MASHLSPAKVLLLAVHLTGHVDIDGLTSVASCYPWILRGEILLRIVLTYLPETVNPDLYIDFLRQASTGNFTKTLPAGLNTTAINNVTEDEAERKAKKLRLLNLYTSEELKIPDEEAEVALYRFLLSRAYQMDKETGNLIHILELLLPFAKTNTLLQVWTISTVLPFVRKNMEFYHSQKTPFTLSEFEQLPDRLAASYLLEQSCQPGGSELHITRDLRSLIAPWLYDQKRWVTRSPNKRSTESTVFCPGWDEVLKWLLLQSTSKGAVAIRALEEWSGASDVEFVPGYELTLSSEQQHYLACSYNRARIACIYSTQETAINSLNSLYRISTRLSADFNMQHKSLALEEAISQLPDLSGIGSDFFQEIKSSFYTRSDLLEEINPLTTPAENTTTFVVALTLSVCILSRLGVPCTVRRAADLALLREERDQRGELSKIMRAISSRTDREEDEYWDAVRRQVLWLRDWGRQYSAPNTMLPGILGTIKADLIELEFLKLLLSKGRYLLARTLYEHNDEKPLSDQVVQDAIYKSALNAFDNASNPNRTRGGLKRCDEILHALPTTVPTTLEGSKQIQALLKATHALSDYRLVLKQGEPFNPVVLRVHSDPISILEKVLAQNAKAYTRLQEFLEMGLNMVRAGLPVQGGGIAPHDTERTRARGITLKADIAERRITAMAIQAALREDDFETAYSYVASRLTSPVSQDAEHPSSGPEDEWSWKAALQAGQYIRTDRSQKPTHLGTASGNLEIRHLEQRIECLATALRAAPTNQLLEILKSFRRCEEQLDSAIKDEAANEAAWDAKAVSALPGSFDAPTGEKMYPPRNMTAAAAAKQADEAPMSLFDLSRATARAAQRNFTTLSALPQIVGSAELQASESSEDAHQRVRKRDQLREAATGTLVSGVGWLIGANVNQPRSETS